MHSNSSLSSTPPLSSSSTLTDLEISLSQLFGGESGNFGGDKEKTVLLKIKINSLQREIFRFSPTINNNKLRCIITRFKRELSPPGNKVGPWFVEEPKFHLIFFLKLQAAKLAIMSFTLKERDAISVDIRLGNMIALSYFMKVRCTKNQELTAINKEIWQYLLKQKITITAECLEGSINVEADRESR